MNLSSKSHVASCLIFGLAVSASLHAGEIAIKPYRTGPSGGWTTRSMR